jgi:acyl-CoA oxidase
MIQVRPNAVSLVDAFDHTDHYLGSALGRYDGDVYSTLYREAWKDPLNELPVTEGYSEFIRPILKKELQLSKSRM